MELKHSPPKSASGTLDALLARLGSALADDHSRFLLRRAVRRFLKIASGVLSYGLAVLLILLWLLFQHVGERNLTLAFALYLPRSIFLLPALLVLFPALLFHRRSALALVLAIGVFLAGAMDFRPPAPGTRPAPVPGRSLTLMTYNRGEHGNHSLRPFKNEVSPDVILLQEAPNRASGYLVAEGYEEFPHAQDCGEFTILSRHPVTSADLVELEPGAPPIAARFTITFAGRDVAIYSVHTVSPRDTLLYYRRGAFLYGILGLPGSPWEEKRRANQAYWDQRVNQARALADLISSDPLPTLVGGDFNAPAGGYIHDLFLNHLQDAHRTSGQGFGYTFPGKTRNPLSFGGPWMRIDHLYGDEDWKVTWCLTEPNRPSQHRAVAARFEQRDESRTGK